MQWPSQAAGAGAAGVAARATCALAGAGLVAGWSAIPIPAISFWPNLSKSMSVIFSIPIIRTLIATPTGPPIRPLTMIEPILRTASGI
ncbi:MAG TPA: hypothetical protein VFE41_31005 [Acetobacteraceae bacterium]|jgi:hypothetical protein|nr:hypothetical protein [Acetobacteraceae bacterium]